MIKYLTETSAKKVYIGILIFFFWVFILGILDFVVLPETLLMNVVSERLATTSLVMITILGILPNVRGLTAFHRYRYIFLWLGGIAFLGMQLMVWDFLSVPINSFMPNPYARTLLSVMTLLFFIALALKPKYRSLSFRSSRRTLMTLAFIIITGSSVWYALGARAIYIESENARTKINLIGHMIDSSFVDKIKALERIKARIEHVAWEDANEVMRHDIDIYIQDYEIIEGIILFDSEQEVLMSSPFGAAFVQAGMLSSQTTQTWLSTPAEFTRVAANSRSLDSTQPIVMIAVPINERNGRKLLLLALLNLNELVARDYLSYLDAFRTYMAFDPETLVSMQGMSDGTHTLADLQTRYQHWISKRVTLVTGVAHDFYSFLVDYQPIKQGAQVFQLILWGTGAFALLFVLTADTSHRLRKESEKLANMARFDELTGFLRRDAFNFDISRTPFNCKECHRAVLFVNLDNFNSVNDGVGHRVGDRVLAQSANRIRQAAINAVMFARFSNDEFIVYYENTDDSAVEADALAVLKAITKAYEVDNLTLHLTASIGISTSSSVAVKTESLIQQADVAMAEAKLEGGNQFIFYRKEMKETHEQLIALRSELQIAMNDDKLQVFYQPIFSSKSHKIVSVEALVRWPTDEGFISPALFIPVAEKTGQIVQLGEQVLRKVFTDLSANKELREITVAVNISPRQFGRAGFVDRLLKDLRKHKLQPSNLTLELTETVMSQPGRTDVILRELREHGIHIAIDDFGTGFSSLEYLSDQPADIIKIDRAFTLGVETEIKKRNLLGKMIEMCKQLDKLVVVEGVETEQQSRLFEGFGVDTMQGFFFAKPMPLNELLEKLRVKSS